MLGNETLDELVGKWRAQSIAFLPGLGEERLLAFENHFSIRLPSVFRDYLKVANGMDRGAWDGDMIHFWNLDEIAEHLSIPGTRDKYPFVPFADYSMDGCVWGLPTTPNGDVIDSVCIFGPPLEACAPSFLTFVSRYLLEDDIWPKALAPRCPPHLSWRLA
jgi:hypothetical protein